jgi:hypothetical protein
MAKNQFIAVIWKELARLLSEVVHCGNLERGSQLIVKEIRSSFPDGRWRLSGLGLLDTNVFLWSGCSTSSPGKYSNNHE